MKKGARCRKALVHVVPTDPEQKPYAVPRRLYDVRRKTATVRLWGKDWKAERHVLTWIVREGPSRPGSWYGVAERHDLQARSVLATIPSSFAFAVLAGRSRVSAIVFERHRIWALMDGLDVPIIAIARLFHHHHASVLSALGRLKRNRV